MRAGRRRVRANGQRDGVGKTSDWASALEHIRPILDPARVSPYRPAAHDMPQSMRPDTRQHLTACSEPSEEKACIYGGVHTRPVPEAGSETVRHGRDLQVLQEPRQPGYREWLPALAGEHERAAAVAERPCRLENLRRAVAQRNPVLTFGLHAHGRHGPHAGRQIDLGPPPCANNL